jgi:CBS domain-containing membrane protein
MQNETLAAARARMQSRGLRCLREVNRVGIGDALVTSGDALVASAMREPLVASPEQKVMSLVAQMASGVAHQVVVTDPDRRVLGLITRTDLVAAMARSGGGRLLTRR